MCFNYSPIREIQQTRLSGSIDHKSHPPPMEMEFLQNVIHRTSLPEGFFLSLLREEMGTLIRQGQKDTTLSTLKLTHQR